MSNDRHEYHRGDQGGNLRHTTEAEQFWENHYSRDEQVSSDNANPVLVDVAGRLPPGTVLDLGCGEGGDAIWLARQGWCVRAVDVSATALQRVAARATAAGVADRVTCEQHDLIFTFPAGSFDLISAQYLHSPVDFPSERVLQTAACAVAPGGLLLIVEHASIAPWSWNQDPQTHFPTPHQLAAGLDLDPNVWHLERADASRRRARGPGGQRADVVDTVVLLRRRGG